jgi:hypothetical protein
MVKRSLLYGVAGSALVIVAGITLSAQASLSLNSLLVLSAASLLILLLAAAIAGWKARREGSKPSLAGAIVGGLIAIGMMIGNSLLVASPAYQQVLANAASENGTGLTGFTPTIGSVLSTLLINILLGTIGAAVGARLARQQRTQR